MVLVGREEERKKQTGGKKKGVKQRHRCRMREMQGEGGTEEGFW